MTPSEDRRWGPGSLPLGGGARDLRVPGGLTLRSAARRPLLGKRLPRCLSSRQGTTDTPYQDPGGMGLQSCFPIPRVPIYRWEH